MRGAEGLAPVVEPGVVEVVARGAVLLLVERLLVDRLPAVWLLALKDGGGGSRGWLVVASGAA